jgi:hypothetical protein
MTKDIKKGVRNLKFFTMLVLQQYITVIYGNLQAIYSRLLT